MTAEPDEYQRDYETVSGMREALETLKPEHWAGKEESKPGPLSQFVQFPGVDKVDELLRSLKKYTEPAKIVHDKIVMGVESPSILVSALPFVRGIRLNNAIEELSTIPEGQDLVDVMRDGLKLELHKDPRFTGGANSRMVCVEDGKPRIIPLGIEIDAYAPKGFIVGVLAHELHHQRQMDANVIVPYMDKLPSPIETVWYDRMIEADAAATSAEIAWKLKDAGKPGMWENLGGFGFACGHAFAMEAMKDPSSVYDGRAKRAAFDEWFSNSAGRVNIYNGQGVNNALSEGKMEKLVQGGMPMETIKVSDIEKLGELSSGPNYLKLEGARPLDDPYYRAPSWNKDQAMRLGELHDKYDTLKKGSGTLVAAGKVCEDQTNAVSSTPVSLERPATRRPPVGGMKL